MLLQDIPTFYINLKKREDRNKHILQELKKINIKNFERFNAIEMTNGAIGCSLSHIKCLEMAIKRNYEYVMICEDDVEILNPELFIKNINTFLNSSIKWDVVLIAGNNMLPYKIITDYCIQINNCLTTTGYIVKKYYFETLLENYKEGIQKLLREPTNNNYKIDKYWLFLQNKDNWFLIIPPTIVQREDYSDIEKKKTNFKNYMLNYNKVVKK